MSFDDLIREALQRTTAGLTTQLERDLSAFSDELRRAAIEERDRSAAQRAEEIKRAVQAQVTDVRKALQAQLDDARRAAHAEAEQTRQAAQVEIDAVRRAADTQSRELQHQTEKQLEDGRRALEQRLVDVQRRAGADLESARAEASTLRAELEKLRAGADSTRTEIEKARAEAGAARAALEASHSERDTARLEADVIRTEAATARAEVETLRNAVESAGVDMERARAEAENARLELAKARAEAESARVESARACAEADSARVESARARAEAESARLELEKAQTEVETARADAAWARAALDGAQGELGSARRELAETAGQAEKTIQEAVSLAAALRALDGTHALGEALDVLAERAARHAERTAVLVVQSGRLRGRRLVGFPGQNPVPRVNIDLEAAGIAGAVVKQGVMLSRPAEPQGEEEPRAPGLPCFAENAGARQAVALPLIVGGHVVAVLYADASPGETPPPGDWLAALEVLTRHASRTLEVMTVRQATGLSRPRHADDGAGSERRVANAAGQDAAGDDDAARRYARLLVSEIRMYHEPLVDEGRRSRDLRARLGGEIERARRQYEARVAPALRERSDYFEQELVRTLANGDRSLLG